MMAIVRYSMKPSRFSVSSGDPLTHTLTIVIHKIVNSNELPAAIISRYKRRWNWDDLWERWWD